MTEPFDEKTGHTSFTAFLSGPRHYDPTPPAAAVLAIPATVAIIAASQLAAAGVFVIISYFQLLAIPELSTARIGGGFSGGAPTVNFLLMFAFVSQVVIVALTVALAYRAGVREALQLGPPSGGPRCYAFAIAAMIPMLAVINGFGYLVAPEAMAGDLKQFIELARSPSITPTALVVAVGAPLSEELLFRGYLLSSLSPTRLGYWPAAGIATAGWTLLHFNYSWIGLAEVFAIGMYFSWLLWRTGSLLPALLCHAVYNGCLLAGLRYWPV